MFLSRTASSGTVTPIPAGGAPAADATAGVIPAALVATAPGSDPLEVERDEDGRRTWNVIARKLPYAQRDVARSVMPDDDAAQQRGFQSIGQAALADDDDAQHPVGSTAAYSVKLTDTEAKRFKAASNAIDVSLAVKLSRPPFVWGP